MSDARALHVLMVALVANGTPTAHSGPLGYVPRPALDAAHLAACGLSQRTYYVGWDVEGCNSGWSGCDGNVGRPEAGESVWCACDEREGVLMSWQPEPLEFVDAISRALALMPTTQSSADGS